MRKITGYIEGRAVWSANEPSSAQPAKWFWGALVTGSPGPNDREAHRREAARSRLTANQAKLDDRPIVNGRPRQSPDVERNGRGRKYASEEERIAARRMCWRESSRRARKRSSAA